MHKVASDKTCDSHLKLVVDVFVVVVIDDRNEQIGVGGIVQTEQCRLVNVNRMTVDCLVFTGNHSRPLRRVHRRFRTATRRMDSQDGIKCVSVGKMKAI